MVTLGYCPDELTEQAYTVRLSESSSYSMAAAIKIPSSRLQYLKGSAIKKIRIATEEGLKSTFVWVRQSIDEAGTLALQRLGTTEDGWNEVELSKPYTITGDDIYIGYQGTMTAGKGFYFDGEANQNAAYVGNGVTWESIYEEGRGSLCIQAVVETNADTPQSDVAIEGCTFGNSYTKVGENVEATFAVSNYGSNDVEMPRLFYSLNSEDEIEVPTEGTLKANETRSFSATISTANAKEGYNDLRIWIDANDGYEANNSRDEKLCCYETSFDRKVLVEHFTTLPCVNCPLGHTILSTLLEDRDDCVWVSHHVGFSEDELTVEDSYDISSPLGVSSAPLAAFDRTVFSFSQTAKSPSFTIISGDTEQDLARLGYGLNSRLATPAFVSVDIEGSYDATSRELTATVTGQRTSLLDIFYPDTRLTVQLVEDKVETVEKQNGSGETIHDNVYRKSLSLSTGDNIAWDGDTYSRSYSCILPEKWNPQNLRIVAFMGLPVGDDGSKLEILNANQFHVGSLPDGIEQTSGGTSNATSREYYNLAGQKMNSPCRGVYIERLTTSHGSYTIKHINGK